MKVAFSLKNKPKPAAAPSLKRPTAFASLDDDEPIDAAPTSSSINKHVDANKQLLAQNVVSRSQKQRMEAEMKVDSTVYEYDEVWERMQEVKKQQKMAKEVDSKERKPKYISGLLTSAAQRKRDHLLAEEKMMQYEREAEGDEFKDKESFVTQAYKDQMATAHREAEEEKKQEELRKKGSGSGGMAHFYRQLLEESEQNHEATVAATQKRVIGPQAPPPNMTITKPSELAQLSDLQLAEAARKEGKEVELNDDNQIVDKRDLLAAGLNLSGVNTRRLGLALNSANKSSEGDAGPSHRAAGTAASRREINERRARELQQQLRQEEERVAQEKERADKEAVQRVVLKRNNESDVQSARERYLARKRQRLEQPDTVDE